MTSEDTSPIAALLVVGKSAIFKFDQKEITIGRNNDNDLVIESNKVSRKHARLLYHDGNFELEDLKSTGGTYLNGQKIDKCAIDEGDVITLANVHLVFGRNEFPVAKSTTKYDNPDTPSQGTTTVIRKRDWNLD